MCKRERTSITLGLEFTAAKAKSPLKKKFWNSKKALYKIKRNNSTLCKNCYYVSRGRVKIVCFEKNEQLITLTS